MRIARLSCLFLLLFAGVAFAAPHFPALTGRVVDGAHILSAPTRDSLEQALADYENGTTNQIVVATLPSLQGLGIEEFGYQLGRAWQIGQKGKNNGALLIVAPKERKVRIEVGYGLEPVLTDAMSATIINTIILPDFKAGQMEKGVVDGTQAMLSVLGGKSLPTQTYANAPAPVHAWQLILVLMAIMGYVWLCIRHPDIAWFLFNIAMSSRFSSGSNSGFGGGFSGGGGSFGGGGASGGW